MNENYIHKAYLEKLIKVWEDDKGRKTKMANALPSSVKKDSLEIRIKELETCINELKAVLEDKNILLRGRSSEEIIAEKDGYQLLKVKDALSERYEIKNTIERVFGFELHVYTSEYRRGEIMHRVKIKMSENLNVPNLSALNNGLIDVQDIARYFEGKIFLDKKIANR